MLLLVLLLLTTQAQPRDAAPGPAAGTAAVRGRVLDRDSRQPIPGARLTLLGTDGAARFERHAATDGDGRYQFLAVPPGPYVLMASAGEMRQTHLDQFLGAPGAHTPGLDGLPRPFSLRPGEARDGADILLTRALAIEGVVLDDVGEPIANVRVSVQRAGAGNLGEPRETDDRGFFRLFALPPGAYRLCATPGHVSSPADVRAATRLTRTCHPALDSGPESYIRLTTTDVTHTTLRLVRNGTYTLSGRVFDATGEPAANPSVILHRQMGEGETTSTSLLMRGHEFSVTDLEPGEYMLQASAASSSRDPRLPPRETAWVPIRLDADVAGLPVSTMRGSVVTGRVAFEGERPPHSGVTVQSRREDDLARAAGDRPVIAPVSADGTFVLEGVFGPQLLRVSGLPDGWFVRAVRYGGRDIAHVPTLFPEGTARGLEVVASSEGGAHLSAVVRDSEGKLASSCSVVLVPVEGAKWGIVSAGPREPFPEDGACDLGVVGPGEYFVLASTTAVPPSLFRRNRLVQRLLESGATRITLAPGDRTSVEVRQRNVPEGR